MEISKLFKKILSIGTPSEKDVLYKNIVKKKVPKESAEKLTIMGLKKSLINIFSHEDDSIEFARGTPPPPIKMATKKELNKKTPAKKKTVAKKTPAKTKTTPTKKTVTKKKTTEITKSTDKKSVAKKSTEKKVTAKKPATKKTTQSKTSTKKIPAEKSTVTKNKTATKKTADKKSVTKTEKPVTKNKTAVTTKATPSKKSITKKKTTTAKKPAEKKIVAKKPTTKNVAKSKTKTTTSAKKAPAKKIATEKKTKAAPRGAKKAEKIALYAKDITKHYGEVDEDFLAIIVKNLGPSIYKRDAELVSCSDPKELDTVRKNFLMKKLGIDASQKVLDVAIQDVCEELKATRTKYRATFYYSLAKKFKKESVLS